jgi:hypothetical protein
VYGVAILVLEAAMPETPPALTRPELLDRMKATGIQIPEARLEMVRVLLADALAPVRAMDPRALRTLEPAVTFAATRGADGDR